MAKAVGSTIFPFEKERPMAKAKRATKRTVAKRTKPLRRAYVSELVEKVYHAQIGTIRVRWKGKTIVLMTEPKYEGLVETAQLLSNPANREDIRAGLAEAEAGKFTEAELIED